MDVEESGGAGAFFSASVRHWRPRVIEFIEKIPFDAEGA
jgi:hypothetical protein